MGSPLRWRRIPGPPADPLKARLLRLYVALERRFGPQRVEARHLRALRRRLLARFGGRVREMRRAALPSLRRELLAVRGLGPETVDAILLHAVGRPVFVADAHARRVLARHGLLPQGVGYEEARRVIEAHLPSDPALLNEFHALLLAAAKADGLKSPA